MSLWRKAHISFGFFLLTAWFALANGWRLLVMVLFAAALHELGHWAVLRLMGVRIGGLRLGVCGAELEMDSAALSYGGELAAVVAGPGMNLLCAMLLARLGWETAAGAHLILGGFNLLPVRPLDGGQALCLALSWMVGPTAGEGIARIVGTVTALVIAGMLAGVMTASGGSLWLLPPLCGMLVSACREVRGFFPEK